MGTAAAAAACLLALAACGSSDDTTTGSDGTSSAGASTPAEPTTADAVLTTADSPLGTIVVDAQGRTLYAFTKDAQGATTSSCTDQCLAAWPPAMAESTDLAGDGVTADIGTITSGDGSQLTLDGWPLYLFAKDAAAGDTNGQGVGSVWYVVAPDGSMITKTP